MLGRGEGGFSHILLPSFGRETSSGKRLGRYGRKCSTAFLLYHSNIPACASGAYF